jgi:predicted unusual protein kinase regulating ubiquinone biosynthesis (AarF/ABC1/UbiB family)
LGFSEIGGRYADPHPGNILLQTGGRVAFVDFGIFGKPSFGERISGLIRIWRL